MILNLITSKEDAPQNGDLEVINNQLFNSFNTLDSNKYGEDLCKKALIISQLQNISGILELAESNLIFSCKRFVESFCKHFFDKKNDINLQEKISGDFILNSIIYYNASFDYIRVLLRLIYSSNQELQTNYNQKKIEEKLNFLSLEKVDWFIALGSLITISKNFNDWWKKIEIPQEIRDCFKKINEENEKLRKNYQANQLKHGAIPCFKKSDKSNVLGFRFIIPIEQFYSCKNKTEISLRFHKNLLNINETQEFLIKYHNITINLLNKI